MTTSTAYALDTAAQIASRIGLAFSRHFASEGNTEDLSWEFRTASIMDATGKVIFEQQNVLVPAAWSQMATNIVASKYFHGPLGSSAREHSVGQLVVRVVDTIAQWGHDDGYFDGPESAANFRLELAHLLLHQKASFNSPVWFNVGVSEPRGYGFVYDRDLDAVRPLREGENRTQCSAVSSTPWKTGWLLSISSALPRSRAPHASEQGVQSENQRFASLKSSPHSFRSALPPCWPSSSTPPLAGDHDCEDAPFSHAVSGSAFSFGSSAFRMLVEMPFPCCS